MIGTRKRLDLGQQPVGRFHEIRNNHADAGHRRFGTVPGAGRDRHAGGRHELPGWHVSTRPHNRKVVYHAPSKSWFVFHGTGAWADKTNHQDFSREIIAWRRSGDGVRFTPLAQATVGNGHTSSVDVVLAGDRVYLTAARFSYWRTKAGIPWMLKGKPFFHPDNRNLNGANYQCPFEVFPFDIAGGSLSAGQPVAALPGDAHMGNEGPHYGSLTRDTSGYFWAAARSMAGLDGRFVTWVTRTTRPDDITAWQPHTVMFKSNGPGTHAPQIIALDQGRVALILFVKNELRTSVYLYDPRSHAWGSPHVLSGGYESKRASAVFDPGSRRLHIVYTDNAGDARHRAWAAPYDGASFSPPLDQPGTMVAPKAGANPGDDDLSLSANLAESRAAGAGAPRAGPPSAPAVLRRQEMVGQGHQGRAAGSGVNVRRSLHRSGFLPWPGVPVLVPVEGLGGPQAERRDWPVALRPGEGRRGTVRPMMRACGLLVAFVAPAACADAGAWVRPERADAPLIWGRTDGSVFGLASAGVCADRAA